MQHFGRLKTLLISTQTQDQAVSETGIEGSSPGSNNIGRSGTGKQAMISKGTCCAKTNYDIAKSQSESEV